MPGLYKITSLLLAFAIGVLLPMACCCAAELEDLPTPAVEERVSARTADHSCCDSPAEPAGPVPTAPERDCGCGREFAAIPHGGMEPVTVDVPVAAPLFPGAQVPAFLIGMPDAAFRCHSATRIEDSSLSAAPTLRALSILFTV